MHTTHAVMTTSIQLSLSLSYKELQQLSYRKQIARKLRTLYAKGINSNPVTLKSTLTETEPMDRSYTSYYLSSYLTVNIIVTLKCGLEVAQGH